MSDSLKKVASLQRQLRVACLWTPLLRGLSFWVCVAGVVLLLARSVPFPLKGVWIGSGVGGFVVIIIALVVASRRWPSVDQVTALLDARAARGGLVMAHREPGGTDWSVGRLPVFRASWGDWRSAGALFASLVFLSLAVLLPMPRQAPPPGQLQVESVVESMKEQVDVLESLEVIDEWRAEEFRKELEAIEAGRDASDPAASWEALDNMGASMATVAEEELEESRERLSQQESALAAADQVSEAWLDGGDDMSPEIAERAAAELAEMLAGYEWSEAMADAMSGARGDMMSSNATTGAAMTMAQMQAMREALASLTEEERARLRSMMEAGLMQESRKASGMPSEMMTAEALSQMLKKQRAKQGSGSCSNLSAACSSMMLAGGTPMASHGAGEPGKGGLSRGPGEAPLAFSGETDEQGFLFAPEVLPKGATGLDDSTLVGLGARAPEVDVNAAASSGGAVGEQDARGASASVEMVLPGHRRAVQRYFERMDSP